MQFSFIAGLLDSKFFGYPPGQLFIRRFLFLIFFWANVLFKGMFDVETLQSDSADFQWLCPPIQSDKNFI